LKWYEIQMTRRDVRSRVSLIMFAFVRLIWYPRLLSYLLGVVDCGYTETPTTILSGPSCGDHEGWSITAKWNVGDKRGFSRPTHGRCFRLEHHTAGRGGRRWVIGAHGDSRWCGYKFRGSGLSVMPFRSYRRRISIIVMIVWLLTYGLGNPVKSSSGSPNRLTCEVH
jgi:hypothetical protein